MGSVFYMFTPVHYMKTMQTAIFRCHVKYLGVNFTSFHLPIRVHFLLVNTKLPGGQLSFTSVVQEDAVVQVDRRISAEEEDSKYVV